MGFIFNTLPKFCLQLIISRLLRESMLYQEDFRLEIMELIFIYVGLKGRCLGTVADPGSIIMGVR